MAISSRFSIQDKTRGNILLKAWEHSISERRKKDKEMRDACEETFILINKNLLDLDKEGSVGTLGKIDIAKHLLDIKENVEKGQVELSQVSQVDISQVDKWYKTKLVIMVYHHGRPTSRKNIGTVGNELLHFQGEHPRRTFQDDSPISRKVCYLYRAGERTYF